ncbi:hybrid sensor histidine kinase/response regulator [Leptolyngbya iicbica]|uniref:histidine kinase n=2 Tax=Cyanophyceae TaxID=3028117 RepID=A0A4Q7E653_9CYAN|nr:response regulator [Leptolyngbya sp. LK]RZM75653.1 response regulator [Leptolyngbya sp. LK]
MCPIENILLIEDNRAEARLLQETLKGSVLHQAQVAAVTRLTEGIEHCRSHPVDVIMLDLTLPDSYGLASLDKLQTQVPQVPVVVLTNTNDDALAVEAVRRGAQDYLVKRQVNQELLVRSLRYAIERQQIEEALREANETLEQRVQRRTAQLENANQLLRQEILERQHFQERLVLAQRAAKMGTFEWNLSNGEVIWSPELETLYGMAAGAFQDNYDRWLQTLHPDDRPDIELALQQALTDQKPLETEFRIVRRDDTTRWISVQSKVFFSDSGEPQRIVGIHRDVTENKDLQAQFLRAQRLESLGTLASGIAHDLNNILTPILGVTQLLPLKFPDLPDSTQQLLDTLESSARRGSSLIKQILSFARGVEGKRITLQLSHILQEIRLIVNQTLPKSIEISLGLEPHLWPVVGDVTQLHQVFMNLCVNARDAMPEGGSLRIEGCNVQFDEVTAGEFLAAQPGPYVRVTVADTGKGIPPEIVSRIFDPFFTTKEIGKGTGLGLSAVMGIVQSHGGFVDVKSEVNQGSQFAVYLPASREAAIAPDDNTNLLAGHQETILVVDDEAAIRSVMATVLELNHYQVLTAENGTAALDLYQDQWRTIDLVLIDMMMPGMDGATLMPLLQHWNPHLKAIATSGVNAYQTSDLTTHLGFCDFLAKPFNTPDLLTMLRRHLDE